ncbi:MAG: toprim domain-containing protein [Candidatus Moeniiplasma glomeromycotorum]|nr:toprim domain-containing protein [Candidatus Moeniiplasma glomeromycotorum]MCE8167232.1 toprim domain-containing protein [Candidatus Moeniiplasma glomeromycotorum]MCE8168755.1 toprim domain-containing protein [Candidatus Moeniiplasma glomeromycotorum]
MPKSSNWVNPDRHFYKSLLNTNDILHLLTKKLNFTPKPLGKSIFFLCPFHTDKNPSLSFEPQKKIFTCFSCGFKASDIFDFWTQYKQISFEAALEEISQLGFSEKITPFLLQKKKEQEQEEKDKPFQLLSLISDIYQHNLFTSAGKEVLDYLTRRQVDYSLISRFSLGCSINNWQITNLLFQFEPAAKNLLLTNLVWVNENNQVSDFFSARQLIIPLTDSEEKIVAFAARKIESIQEKPLSKYKYLPSYQYYHKSSLLYNYLAAKRSRATECYVVEGFFDVISLTKSGIENCVALLGTNLSPEQTKLLSDLKKRIVLFLDGDPAGKLATVNIVLQLLKKEIDCEVIKLDYRGDPDEICRQIGLKKELVQSTPLPLNINDILQKRENPYLFILYYCLEKWEIRENPQRIKEFISEISLIFSKFRTNVHHFLIDKISQLVNLKREQVEIYFIPCHFPIPHFFQIKYYLQNVVIQTLEKKIIFLCLQERFFWLLTTTKNYFFSHPITRKNWRNICHYYLVESDEKNLTNQSNLESEFSEFSNGWLKNEFLDLKKKTTYQKSLLIEPIFKKIDSIRLFTAKFRE